MRHFPNSGLRNIPASQSKFESVLGIHIGDIQKEYIVGIQGRDIYQGYILSIHNMNIYEECMVGIYRKNIYQEHLYFGYVGGKYRRDLQKDIYYGY